LTPLVSCSQLPIQRNKKVNTNDRIEKCVLRLVESSGVSAKDAGETCTSIFRQQRVIDRMENRR
jgi:hypothetical protein